jgi:hypothetical protein
MKIWAWFNGKKTILATCYWALSAYIVVIWFPAGLPPVPQKIDLTIGTLLTLAGLGHKVVKKYFAGTEGEDSGTPPVEPKP